MGLKTWIKQLARNVFPGYRVSLRNEALLLQLNAKINEGCASPGLQAACLANEIHETHKRSFSEFKNCHGGRDVVIVACGPSLRYYRQIDGAVHIGVNAAFLNPNVKLDYYFTTDYEHRCEWFEQLKNYNFIKFFGQYPVGVYQEKYQVTERLIEENNGRRFFQGAPSEDIHLNIEYYPLMGFYSVVFQAIHFALYTHPKRIYLVGCDCTGDGYFDGSKQTDGVAEYAVPSWKKGYTKLKDFVSRFYPDIDIVSVNPIGLKGLFRDVYSDDFLLAQSVGNVDKYELI